MRYVMLALLIWGFEGAAIAVGQDKLFSGPQPGEKLSSFRVKGFFEPNSGKELDFVKESAAKPILLVFIHDVNRQSLRFTQVLTGYSIGLDGLSTGVTWLSDDVTDAENTLKRSGHALTRQAPTGISLDGREGPGAYGLNRNVTLTILVGKDNRVIANFALIQPSIQADLPRVLEAIAKTMGGKAPTLEDLLIIPNPKLQGLNLMLNRDATAEEVENQARAIESALKMDEKTRKELGRIISTSLQNGFLQKLGTEKAREYLTKWAKEYGGMSP